MRSLTPVAGKLSCDTMMAPWTSPGAPPVPVPPVPVPASPMPSVPPLALPPEPALLRPALAVSVPPADVSPPAPPVAVFELVELQATENRAPRIAAFAERAKLGFIDFSLVDDT